MEKRHTEKWWYFCLCWVFQTSSWVGVVAFIILFTIPRSELVINEYKDDDGDWVIIRTSLGYFSLAYAIIGPITYLIYIGLEVTSLTFKYLEDFDSNSTIKNKMDYWIKLKPDISIEWDCYHYETRTHTETDSQGRKSTYTEEEKISKDYGTYKFNYFSCRDISGKFTLESNSCLKSYILLNITSSVEFADEETIAAYNKELERIKSYSSKDTDFDLKEMKIIHFLSENQILLTNKCCCCFLNKCIFMFFVLIGIGEIYKILFYCMGSVKYFTVKKAVSRKDLGDNKYSEKYYMQNPSIETPFGNTFYEPNSFIQNLWENRINNTNNNNNENNTNLISFEISEEPKKAKATQDDNETPLLYEDDMND